MVRTRSADHLLIYSRGADHVLYDATFVSWHLRAQGQFRATNFAKLPQLDQREVAAYDRAMMRVQEMFFSVYVTDMQRAVTFYMNALGATVDFASPTWSSLVLAGVRVSLALREEHEPAAIGMHLIVDDVAFACAAVVCAGGQIEPAVETTYGVVIAEVCDSEGNTFTLRQGRARRQAEPVAESFSNAA